VDGGQRGFAIPAQERFLDSWRDAQRAVPGASRRLEQLTADDQQRGPALRVGPAVSAYARASSVPRVAAAGRAPDSARTVAATDEGRQRIDAIRAEFDRLVTTERGAGGARGGASGCATAAGD